MSFTAQLHQLLINADFTVVGGYSIEQVCDVGADDNGDPVLRATCDDDNEWHFADQEVTVDADGQCSAMTAPGDWGDSEKISLQFQMVRPVSAADFPRKPNPDRQG